jgi:Lrp/AsnC family transcriptional regulator, regulator for asnA, asnC and gidA
LDKIDRKILDLLCQDAQMPFYKVAKIVGISPRTVELRFQKLVQEKVVLQSTIQLDLNKIGYAGKAYISITSRPGADRCITVNELKKIDGIFLITHTIGDFDILALTIVKDFAGVIEIMDHIRKLPSVEKADVSFVQDNTYPVDPWVHNQLH